MLVVGQVVRLTGSSKWTRMGPWTIQKVNPTKYKLVNGEGTILNAPHHMVSAVEGGEYEAPRVNRPEGMRVGAVGTVTFYGSKAEAEFGSETLWVVIKDSYDTINIVPLGGDEKRRYWTIAPSAFHPIKIGVEQ